MILMNNPKLCRQEQQRGWVVCLSSGGLFSPLHPRYTTLSHAFPHPGHWKEVVQQFSSCQDLGHELISRTSTQDCHYLTPHWAFSLIWKHLGFPAVHIWMRHSCCRVTPSQGKPEMLGRSQSTRQIQNPTITISPATVGSCMAERFQLFPI